MLLLAEHDPAAALAIARRIVREEAVCTPDDLLLRRTDWGAHPTRYRALADIATRALLPPGARISGTVGVVP
jgi:glycerol-3-phosphate dehydrogenase